jgi:small nuclear ribonucleoprotein (snRNP)-like protein
MSSKKVQDFFKNKVSIRLKNGHQFKGLLNKVDNKNGIIILEDIEDLGNAYDKEQLPHDKKIA